MARPKKKDENKRSTYLPPPRVTEDERAAIEAMATQAGLSLTEYMRRACLESTVVAREPLADKRLIHALLTIGRNLNQLTKEVHIFADYDAAYLREVLARIDAVLDKLMQ